jgi:[ribosomal protein S18]-alanine N-acetyltransferase
VSERAARDGDPEIRIEAFDPSDLDSLMEIENRSFTLPWSRGSYEELWPLATIDIRVARAGDELVGYYLVQMVGDEVELHTFAVKPEHRRRRIGERLLTHAIDAAKGRGAQHMFLQVRPSNAPARALYDKMGFIVVGKRRRYYRDNDEDALVMRLTIVP